MICAKRHVDELAQFGGTQQTLGCIVHTRGHTLETSAGGGAHAGDRAVVALLPLYFLTAAHQCGHGH